jgi:von Willebrand factor type A domain
MEHRELGRPALMRGLLAALGCAAVSLALLAGPAAAAPDGKTGVAGRTVPAVATAADDFRACVASGGPTDILLLVDESSSLQGSDPENARVTSAEYLITQLAQFATRSEADLNVGLAVFAQGYSQLQPWRQLNNSTLPQVKTSIESLRDRVHGMETDYWSALDGGRADLAARAAARPGTTSCQAVVWFTDGALNYTVRGSDEDKAAYGAAKPFAPQLELTSEDAVNEARQLATSSICRDGGLADQLRSSKVTLFGIGLSAGNAAPADYSFLESVTTGKSSTDSGTCGKYISPATGEFYLASDIDGLLMAFDGISSTGSSPLVQEQGICQVSRCIDSAHRFVLDQSTPEVRLLATADATGLAASIMSPSGQVLELPKLIGTESALSADGNALKYTWLSEKSLAVSLAVSPEGKSWSGLWQLAFTDPAGQSSGKRSHTNIHITGGLKPAWTNQSGMKLHAGEKVAGLLFGLEDPSGTAVDPASLLGDAKLTASVQDQQGKKAVIADGIGKSELTKPLALDLRDFPVGAAELRLELSITTASTTVNGSVVPGTQLAPSAVTIPLSLIPPPEFPVLAPKIDFGKLDGGSQSAGSLQVAGQGCIWIAPDDKPEIAASPENAGTISISLGSATSPQTCLHVKDATSIPVTFKADGPDNGSVVGRIKVMTAPDDEPEKSLPVSVEFTASMAKPLNSSNFLLALVVALVLGPGIPLLLLYGAKWLVSRIPGRALSSELIPIAMQDGQVLRDGGPFALRPTDLTNLVPLSSKGSRSGVASGIELKARTGWSPFGAGFVSVEAPGRIGAGSGYPGTDRAGLKPRLPLAVHNKWVLLRDADGSRAHVLVLAGGDSTLSETARLEDDILNRLPGLWERLLQASPLPDVGASSSAFGSAVDAVPGQAFSGFGGTLADPDEVPEFAPTGRSAGRGDTVPRGNPWPSAGPEQQRPVPPREPDGINPWGTPRP